MKEILNFASECLNCKVKPCSMKGCPINTNIPEFINMVKEDKYENVDLQKAIDSLEKEDRIVIVLRYYEDMKLEDIAVILDENLSTVKSRLYRSMKKLKLQLEPYDENA